MGDALGMPTQTLSSNQILDFHGYVTTFVPPSPANTVSRGMPAGSVTDDTEQTLLLARQIVSSPDYFDTREWANALINWEKNVKKRDRHDLLGPSTKRALKSLLGAKHGKETAFPGETNGAAMRIAPVGISTPAEPLSALIDRVEQTCRLTHFSSAAIAAASAVAATVSAAIDGADLEASLKVAAAAAKEGGQRGIGDNRQSVANAISRALKLIDHRGDSYDWDEIARLVGTNSDSVQSVPMAFAVLKAVRGDAWFAGVVSANLGGDTDTIGSIAAGMAGAIGGASGMPTGKVAELIAANDLELKSVADSLLDLRQRRRNSKPVSVFAA